MPDLEDHFAHLSPLLESAVLHIASLKLCPFEHASLGALAQARLSLGMALSLLRSDAHDDDLSDEQKHRILELLAREMESANEAMQAAAERFMSGALVQ